MLLRPSGLIGHSLRSGKSPNLCFRSINEFALCAMASKELFPQITLWIPLVFFTVRPWKSPKFFVSQKSSNPEWQGRTVNLLWLVVSKMFFFFQDGYCTTNQSWKLECTRGYPISPHIATPHDTGEDPHVMSSQALANLERQLSGLEVTRTVTLCELENGPFIDDFFHGFT